MAMVPTSPRQTWPKAWLARNPVASSRRIPSHSTITGMAKNDLKNTASPDGTLGAVAFISEAMVMKTMTDTTL